MPVLQLRTSLSLPDPAALCRVLTATLAALLEKEERWVMVEVEGDRHLTLGGVAPCALLDLRSIGADPALAARLSAALCEALRAELGIDPERVFLQVHAPAGPMFGWNRQTFTEL